MPTACLLCRQHKKKCEGSPCARCSTYGVQCTFPEVARQPRTKVAVIKRKLEQVESLVHELNIDNMTSEQLKKNFMKSANNKKFQFPIHSSPPIWVFNSSSSSSNSLGPSTPHLIPHIKQPMINVFRDRLLATFIEYVHPTLPFIDLDRLAKLHNSQSAISIYSSPLLNAVYCRGFRILRLTQKTETPLDQDYFYQLTLRSLANSPSFNELDFIQAEMLISLLEFSQDEVALASRRIVKIIALAHSLQLQDPDALCHLPFSDTHDTSSINSLIEKSATWAACIITDFKIALLTKTPPMTNITEFDLSNTFTHLSRLVEDFLVTSQLPDANSFFFSEDQDSTDSSTKSPPELSYLPSSPSDSESQSSYAPPSLTINDKLLLYKKFILIPKYLSLMHTVIDLSTVPPVSTDFQSEKRRLAQVLREARSLLPSLITSSYVISTKVEQDPHLVINFILYLTYHTLNLQVGIKLIQLTNLPTGAKNPDKFNSCLPVKKCCSGAKQPPKSCKSASNSCSSKAKPSSFNPGCDVSSILASSAPACSVGRQMVYQSAQIVTQAFNHSLPGYWEPFAASTLLIPSALILVLMASKSDPASDAASVFKSANRLLSIHCSAWPIFRTKTDWGEPVTCGLDNCPSKLPDSLSC